MSGANMENSVQDTSHWMKDDFTKETTTIPEIVIAEDSATGSLAVIIISAILSITLLFLVAIFIDCRHQKMKNGKLGSKMFKVSLPKFGVPRIDRETIADKMEAHIPTAAPATTVIV